MNSRTEAIQKLGYSPREAEFLTLAALHSGAFVTRHFTDYSATTSGKVRDTFTAKLRVNRHVSVHPSSNRTSIFQLSKTIFSAIGESDNRNRRMADTVLTRRRMMALDFVLQHRGNEYLATEYEKVSYFRDTLKLPELRLPSREYLSKRSVAGSTRRFFVEKMPIFIQPEGASIVYIDSDGSQRNFQTFVAVFRPLLASLANAALIFVTPSELLVPKAEAVFRKLRFARSTGPDLIELEAEFRERKALESMPRSAIPAKDLTRLIQLRKSPNARFYAQWTVDGLAELEAETVSRSRLADLGHVVFKPCVMAADYSFLG